MTDWRKDTGTHRAVKREAEYTAARAARRRRNERIIGGIVLALMLASMAFGWWLHGHLADAHAQTVTVLPPPTTSPVDVGTLPDSSIPWPPAVEAGLPHVKQAAEENKMDWRALALLWSIEAPNCTGNASAACVSKSGARGPGQVMPSTAAEIEAATGWPCTSQPFDTLTSLRCGGWYYVQRMRQAAGVWTPEDEAPNLGVAGVCYHDGPVSAGCTAALAAAGAGSDPCGAPGVTSMGRVWCRRMVDGWRHLVGKS